MTKTATYPPLWLLPQSRSQLLPQSVRPSCHAPSIHRQGSCFGAAPLGRDLFDHSPARVDRPFWARIPGSWEVVIEIGDEVSDHGEVGGHHAHGRCSGRNATTQREGYVPTAASLISVCWNHALGTRACNYLDLQHIVSSDPSIVHLMICVICITASLVLDKGKPVHGKTKGPDFHGKEYEDLQATGRCSRSWNVTAD